MRTCTVCQLQESDPAKLTALNEALRAQGYRAVAQSFGFHQSTVQRHLVHLPPDIAAARAAAAANRSDARPDAGSESSPASNPPRTASPNHRVPGRHRQAQRQASTTTPDRRQEIAVEPPQVRVHPHHATHRPHGGTVDFDHQAWLLRKDGKSYAQIAEALGCDYQTAWAAVKRALTRTAQLTQDTIQVWREIELTRLEELEGALRPQALNAQVIIDQGGGPLGIAVETEAQHRAALVLIQISKERRKLLGLDAPKQAAQAPSVASMLGMTGPRALPAILSQLDPPITPDELRRFALTGEMPQRGQPVTEQSYVHSLPPRATKPVFPRHDATAQGAVEGGRPADLVVEAVEPQPEGEASSVTAPSAARDPPAPAAPAAPEAAPPPALQAPPPLPAGRPARSFPWVKRPA